MYWQEVGTGCGWSFKAAKIPSPHANNISEKTGMFSLDLYTLYIDLFKIASSGEKTNGRPAQTIYTDQICVTVECQKAAHNPVNETMWWAV